MTAANCWFAAMNCCSVFFGLSMVYSATTIPVPWCHVNLDLLWWMSISLMFCQNVSPIDWYQRPVWWWTCAVPMGSIKVGKAAYELIILWIIYVCDHRLFWTTVWNELSALFIYYTMNFQFYESIYKVLN